MQNRIPRMKSISTARVSAPELRYKAQKSPNTEISSQNMASEMLLPLEFVGSNSKKAHILITVTGCKQNLVNLAKISLPEGKRATTKNENPHQTALKSTPGALESTTGSGDLRGTRKSHLEAPKRSPEMQKQKSKVQVSSPPAS